MTTRWESLKFFLIDALSLYSEDFTVLSHENPLSIKLNGVRYSVHISSIHDSGEGRSNKDEQRIQPQRNVLDTQVERANNGYKPLFLGFFPDGTIFSAWDPVHVFAQNPESGGSVYARFSHYEAARDYGGALRIAKLKNVSLDASILSFRSEALGFYFENWRTLHDVKEQEGLRMLVGAAVRPIEATEKTGTTVTEVEIAGERKTITTTRTGYARDPNFSRAVLSAYEHSCCVCGRQLGLVEAAHIIPHNHPDCQNHVTNGLALCVEHHRLYDGRLLIPTSGQRFVLNEERVEHLRNIRQDSGIEAVRALAATNYRVPKDVPNRPNDAYLERGIRIRLGTDA